MAKLVPRDRKARRKRGRKINDEKAPDSNVAEIIPAAISEKEKEKKELKDSIRAQQPKMSSKKSKRLDRYIVSRTINSISSQTQNHTG